MLSLNIKNLLNELQCKLNEIPNELWDNYKCKGFKYLYLYNLWENKSIEELIDKKIKGLNEENTISIIDYKLNSDFGNNNDLKNLIDKLHNYGFKIIVDFVIHFVNKYHRWMTEKNKSEYFIKVYNNDLYKTTKQKIDIYGNKCFYILNNNNAYLNLSNQEVINKLTFNMCYLIETYNIDGFRCHKSYECLNKYFNRYVEMYKDEDYTVNGNNEPIKFIIDKVKKIHNGFLFIGEASNYGNYNMLLQNGFDYVFIIDKNPIKSTNNLIKYSNELKMCKYLEDYNTIRINEILNDDYKLHKLYLYFNLLTPGITYFNDGQMTGRTKDFEKEKVDKNISFLYKQAFSVFKYMNLSEDDLNNCLILRTNEQNIFFIKLQNKKKHFLAIFNFNKEDVEHIFLLNDANENIKKITNIQLRNLFNYNIICECGKNHANIDKDIIVDNNDHYIIKTTFEKFDFVNIINPYSINIYEIINYNGI